MSKAFTRENDEVEQFPPTRQLPSSFSSNAKNYFTTQGLQRLQHELDKLLADPITRSNRQRIFEIQQRLQFAITVPPPPPPWNQVFFGATVLVRNQKGEETAYHIVGTNETDTDRNFISWLSPLGNALLKAHMGGRVHFKTPVDLTIIRLKDVENQLVA
jgi:transcription elongation factor GreB